MSKRGKQLETQAKKILSDHFRTPHVFKLINTEQMDFIVLDCDGAIQLVEAKQTKKKFYHPKSSRKKIDQLMKYMVTIRSIRETMGTTSSKFWLLARLRGKIFMESYETIEEIPTRIEI